MPFDLPLENQFVLPPKMKGAVLRIEWNLLHKFLFAKVGKCSLSANPLDEMGQNGIEPGGRDWDLTFSYSEMIDILDQVPASKINSVKANLAAATDAEGIVRESLKFLQWVFEKYVETNIGVLDE